LPEQVSRRSSWKEKIVSIGPMQVIGWSDEPFPNRQFPDARGRA
jgi:hypothetical protein